MNKQRTLQAEFGYWEKEPTITNLVRADKTIIEMAKKNPGHGARINDNTNTKNTISGIFIVNTALFMRIGVD